MKQSSWPVQTGMLGVILVLAGIWLLTPERREMFSYSVRWYAVLIYDLRHLGDPSLTLLEPMSPADGASLVQFRDISFLGCDLTMRGTKVYLITRWQGLPKETQLEARLTFWTDGRLLATEQWSLDPGDHYTEVPANFFRGRLSREIQLMVVDKTAGVPVSPTSVLLPMRDMNVRICN